MMFNHNQQPFDGDASFKLAYKHTTQVNFGGQFALSACQHIPKSECIPARVGPGVDLEFERSALWSMDDSLAVGCTGGSIRHENYKRPNNDDHSNQFGCKRTRQLDSDKSPPRSTCKQFYAPVTAHAEFKSRKGPAAPEDSTKKLHGSSTYSANEEDMRLEAPIRLSSFPGYYEDYHRAAESNQLEEIHSPVFDSPPRKRVSLGRDHQADIPVWRSKCVKSSPGGSDSHDASTSSERFLIDEDNTDRWTKFCVMPMPDPNSLAPECLVGRRRDDCYCLDEGSMRCIKQHVIGAREKLRVTLGRERFAELGFCDMGEDVALRWTDGEERLFHEIVESNPASLGKNFWDVLPEALPSRSSKELVSYYFNVFMLRKRAEQNRSDPLNVDSDDDEWQDSDDDEWQDSDDGEFGTAEEDEEEDEDSAVESPVDIAQNIGVLGEVDVDEADQEEDGDDDEGHDIITEKSKLNKNFVDGSSPGLDQDVHDDSCTSYEDQHNRADTGSRADVLEATCHILLEDDHRSLHAEYMNDGMSGMADHKFITGLCDPRPWEMIGYTRAVEKDIDFLPTCSVIDEVFGQEYWENGK